MLGARYVNQSTTFHSMYVLPIDFPKNDLTTPLQDKTYHEKNQSDMRKMVYQYYNSWSRERRTLLVEVYSINIPEI